MLGEYNFKDVDRMCREATLRDVERDLDKKHKQTVKHLSVSFEVNIEFHKVEKLITWLETGLRVWADEKGWEITDRKIEDQ